MISLLPLDLQSGIVRGQNGHEIAARTEVQFQGDVARISMTTGTAMHNFERSCTDSMARGIIFEVVLGRALRWQSKEELSGRSCGIAY